MNVELETFLGDKMTLKIINGDSLEIVLNKKNIMLSEDDVKALNRSIRKIQNNFDSVFFQELQNKITSYSAKVIEKLTDERLMALAKYNDKNPPYFRTFTLNLRTELFRRNNLSRAKYKLTFKQKAFLYAHGLKRN